MQDLLYLVHRIPYPPDKGDKIRSYHLLKHLSRRYRVHLGTFIDDPRDRAHIETVKGLCGETCFIDLSPRIARLRSLGGMLLRQPLTLPYYRSGRLQAWVNGMLETRSIPGILVFSSGMAQYVRHAAPARRIIDFVDIDSDKWMQYAATRGWPMNWIYRRESRLLLEYERRVAAEFDGAAFVSAAEADLFRRLAPEAATKVTHFNNGVDTDYFSPGREYPNPYAASGRILVFTGAMDYWANVDAVEWFVRDIFPALRRRLPDIEFHIVGARPTARVMTLSAVAGVRVAGSVPDIRPYLAHASLAVAPLRIARGIQNKVLEAMAMEKTVIASPQAMEGICALPGKELLVAANEREFVQQIIALLQHPAHQARGQLARARILKDYTWESGLARVDALLSQSVAMPPDIPYTYSVEGYLESAEDPA
ncbi:TIGR03087 family PEP-CTERM/XrtA system glycosyltransferase [Nitrosovibrio sp. Nv17]|uniref:TIGR03087 family PEP-CTERM/XrtA system glycosyltransferase n=1 Tax=Nitrosovibrio sp. Nv17 TaxID=1855339 RepID=UPI0009087BF5|nr:TIGR03087 family PEP-CTERM/XrtA system glycosyltransferase [Nitrosovibrio sp. Nv17]SFW20286.1 sugar transferase, PEP-CTERM/EpsH1 system associated [Nitrosovibrio sp. Nv17]